MKIVYIFAPNLLAFKYEETDEYNRLMDLWMDVSYLRAFALSNNIADPIKFVHEIISDAEQIQDLMEEIAQNGDRLESFFRPLNNLEVGYKELSLQKGRVQKSKLRLYAIKVDENLFVITGGAIKITQFMDQHLDTQQEKAKLERAKQYLRSQQVFDEDSFFELLTDD